jgi:hypothetical protein
VTAVHGSPQWTWGLGALNDLPAAMLRAQRRETEEGGWAELPAELFEKVLEMLQAAGNWGLTKPQEGGLGFTQPSATVRLVCAGWKAVHDAMVTMLVLRPVTTDDAVGMLARRFPTVVSLKLEDNGYEVSVLTDKGMGAVSSLPALTSLNLTWCIYVTDEGVRAVSSCIALKSLNLYACINLTDEAVRVVSSLPALTSLNLGGCKKVTDECMRAVSSCTALKSLNLTDCVNLTDAGVRAVSSCTALTSLNLFACIKATDAGVRALSCLPALTSLDLRHCRKVTAAGVRALRITTAAPSLHIEF